MPATAILNQHGQPFVSRADRQRALVQKMQDKRALRARYDSAETHSQNERHWAAADSLGPVEANNPAVRQRLRDRARYETQNNCYAQGIVDTLANYVIGTGPRLQLMSPYNELNEFVEREFSYWAMEVDLAAKLRLMNRAWWVDGEVFALGVNNPRSACPVQLDLRPIETDLVTAKHFHLDDHLYVDGIKLDEHGIPVSYDILKHHPSSVPFAVDSHTTHQADQVIHLFKANRPGAARGVSGLAPALPLFAQLRRYVLAVLTSAETAADFVAVMYTDSPALEAEDIPNLSMDELLDIKRNMFQILPNGWKMGQMKAEQPTTVFEQFRDAIINEIARCVNMPFNIAAGNSSRYNYASGRLDHQSFFQSVAINRQTTDFCALRKLFRWWLDEAVLVAGYLPEQIQEFSPSWISWHWDGQGHVDPAKEASGQMMRLKAGTTHRYREYAREGLDIDKEDAQAAASFGLSVQQYRRMLAASIFGVTEAELEPALADDEEDD